MKQNERIKKKVFKVGVFCNDSYTKVYTVTAVDLDEARVKAKNEVFDSMVTYSPKSWGRTIDFIEEKLRGKQ